MSTCVATECVEPVVMCDLFKGNTVPYVFTFTQDDGTPLQTGNMELVFTMKLHPDDADDADGALYKKVVFPAPVEPATGIEYMTLTSEDTAVLVADRVYHYKFVLTNPMVGVPDEVFTVGFGTVKVI